MSAAFTAKVTALALSPFHAFHRATRSQPAGDLLREAMQSFERAETVKPADNDDALLRWNACARLFERHPELMTVNDERTAPVMLE